MTLLLLLFDTIDQCLITIGYGTYA